MIEIEGVQPGGVIDFRLSGHVTGIDSDKVLIPAIETAIEKYGKLRTLFVFDEGFEGYDLEAAWDDTKVGLRHWNVFERVAVVTDVGWIKKGISVAGFLVACPVQTFPPNQAEDARRWLRESLGSLHLEFDDDANRLTVRLLGKLEPSAYHDVAEEIDGWMAQREGIHLVVDLREFDGWQGLAALGEHLALVHDHRRVIERVDGRGACRVAEAGGAGGFAVPARGGSVLHRRHRRRQALARPLAARARESGVNQRLGAINAATPSPRSRPGSRRPG